MLILKILAASFLYPFLNYKETLNAITIPFLIYTINWAVGFELALQDPLLGWLSLIIQIFALSMLLTNCCFLVMGETPVNAFSGMNLYLRVFALFAVWTIVVTVFQYLLIGVLINVVLVQSQQQTNLVSIICQLMSRSLLFWMALVIPHYIFSGDAKFRNIFHLSKALMLQLVLLAFILQGIRLIVDWLLSMSDFLYINYLAIFWLFFIQIVGGFLLGLSYLAVRDMQPKEQL
ncbi:hypothetical protein [Agarivorans sp. JK6]|uniref:hypothetical protein n=1 Tax=Agarivorans sp. JK6 TaxID=2997426 RepID=UPI003872B405